MNIAQTIDHTLLKATATDDEIKRVCQEAIQYNFKTVCVPTCYVELAHEILKDTKVGITTVVGFPLGNETPKAKAFQALEAVINGATDIDTVINIGALKDKKYDYVKKDIEAVVEAAKNENETTVVKVIIETCYLSDEEIAKATEIVVESGADFVKTSTGFGTSGARTRDIKIMKSVAGNKIEIKASGGIGDINAAKEMIELGATRLGVSKGIAIINGEETNGEY